MALLGRVSQRQAACHLECHVGGVDGVGLAVDEGDPKINHWVAGCDAALHLCPQTLLDAGNELTRHRAANDLVDELEPAALRKWFDFDVTDRVLAVAARLLHMAAASLG